MGKLSCHLLSNDKPSAAQLLTDPTGDFISNNMWRSNHDKGTFGALKNKTKNKEVPVVAQRKQIRLVTMRLQVRSLASLSGLRIQHCHELWSRSQMQLRSCDPGLLWLWCRPAAVAPIQHLAWELPHATVTSPKKQSKTKQKTERRIEKNI